MPVISVLMGVYDTQSRTEDLRNSVNSILQQSFHDFEFLICDDGSSAAVVDLLNEIAKADDRVRLIRKGNLYSLPQKLNYCLLHASGAFIARQDADDISMKQRFEKQILFLQQNSQIAFVGCNASVFCEGRVCGERLFPEYPSKEDFLFRLPFLHPTLIFRREAIERVKGYEEAKFAELCEDYDLLLRMYERSDIGYNLQEKLFSYQVTKSDSKKRKYRHRVNEAIVRYRRFKDLGMLPKGWPYIIKPLILGLLPHGIIEQLKKNLARTQ